MSPFTGRHLRAVEEPEPTPFTALRGAMRAAATAPDLGCALQDLADSLASAVNARTAVIAVSGTAGSGAEASAGPVSPQDALRMAISSSDGSPDDVFIRYLGADEERGEEPQGALVAVVPREEGREAWVADVVQGFAELAELCLIHAHRLDDLERDSDADALTGCLTRRAIERSLAAELARSHRSNVAFTIGFLDIDGFKRVNDEHGHLQGDAVLRVVGGALTDAARVTDSIGRYGGDEFLVVMPGTDADPAAAACARLTAGVAAAARKAGLPELRLSVGTSTWAPGMGATELIAEADGAMFGSKRSPASPAAAERS